MDVKIYDDTLSMEKEALFIVTDLKLAVEDINKISRLVSDNSHNQQFIREISNMRPQFMENIRVMLNVTTKQCVQGIVHPALCIVYFKILCHKIIQIFYLIKKIHNYMFLFLLIRTSDSPKDTITETRSAST